MLESSGSLAAKSVAGLSTSGVAGAIAAAALKVAALSAVGGRIELSELIDMLKQGFNDVRDGGRSAARAHERIH